jgi:hypothetical protein
MPKVITAAVELPNKLQLEMYTIKETATGNMSR